MTTVSKSDYLQKYITGVDDTKPKKKKRRKMTKNLHGCKIIDDDVDVKNIMPSAELSDDERSNDDVPQIVSMNDETKSQIKLDPRQWTAIGSTTDEKQVSDVPKVQGSRKRYDSSDSDSSKPGITSQTYSNSARSKQDNSESRQSPVRVLRTRHDSGSDLSPPRGRNKLSKISETLQSTGGNTGCDQSPPRISKKRHDSESDQSPAHMGKKRHGSDSNQSPPRTNKKRHDSGSDQSPPRTFTKRHDSASDLSPPRTNKKRHDSGSDQSPPHKSKRRYDSESDLTPSRMDMKRHKSDSDQSPARISKKKHKFDNDPSPPHNRKKRHDSGSDQSPPRARRNRSDIENKRSPVYTRRKRYGSESDQSPPRASRKKTDTRVSDSLPPSRKQRHNSESDQSPPRVAKERRHLDARQSKLSDKGKSNSKYEQSRFEKNYSGRETKHGYDKSRSHKERHVSSSDSDQSPPRAQTNSSREQFSTGKRKPQQEIRDFKQYSRHSPSLSHTARDNSRGSNKETSFVRRDDRKEHSSSQSTKTSFKETSQPGNKMLERPKETLSGLKAGLQSAEVLRTELKEAKLKENKQLQKIDDEVLGKGAQTVFRDRSTGKLRDIKEESRQEELKKAKENEMKEKYREWGQGLKQQDDRRKQIEEEQYEMTKPLARYEGDEDLERHLREQERAGDPMLQFLRKKKTEGKPKYPVYQGPPPPPNRFNIMPGYRWDGVDRSNGFEKKLFERQSTKIARDEEAYKWSTENM